MELKNLFIAPQGILQKRYEALRSFFVDNRSAEWIARHYNYTLATVYSLVRDFKNQVAENDTWFNDYFFKTPVAGRKNNEAYDEIKNLIVILRKKFLSIPDIKSILDAQNKVVSDGYIHSVLASEGFSRLPRRDKVEKESIAISEEIIKAPQSELLNYSLESFTSTSAGVLMFLPYLIDFGLDKIINNSMYPETKNLSKLNSILAFVALKLSNIRRYTADDMWCMDRGLGLFAGLNVLPKTAWFTSYSSRITRNMNLDFLKSLTALWKEHGLLSDTANMDFVAVPYWGDESHLEKNWSGTRHHALNSVLAALAEDPDSGIITYGDATLRHDNESDTTIEFLDFYKQAGIGDIKYLVFDSKFTTYENLRKIDENNVKFLTIRRRGKNIIEELESIEKSLWEKIKVPKSKGKTRYLNVYEQKVRIKDYGKELRQIAITGHGKIKPALIITNDFSLSQAEIIRKYAKRWLVEKTIAEQTHFFHLNRLSSSMVIKVDFDLTMSILAHNLYRILAKDLDGFENNTSQTLYDKFVCNSGFINCNKNDIIVKLKKKRNLPVVLEAMQEHHEIQIPWLANKILKFEGASTS